MLNEKELREVVVSLYDAAMGVTPWNAFLSRVGDSLAATTVVLFSQVPGQSDSSFFGATGVDAEAQRQYREYFGARNVLMTEGAALHAPGTVRTSETICSRNILLSSEYYNDFMRPADIRYSLALTATRDSDRAVHLSAFRPHGAPPFEEPDTRVFSELYPHLRRAIEIHRRLAEKEQHTGALEYVVSRMTNGVAFLDGCGKPLFRNGVFEDLLKARDGLTLSCDGLSASSPDVARALRMAVADALGGRSGGTIPVARPSGKAPYSVLVSPVLRQMPFLGSAQAAVLVIVSDPASVPDVNVIVLQQLYGLTRAEARVARRLASGATLRHIAAELTVSIHTVRTHVTRILAKTGARRQSDLVRQLLLGDPR